MAPEISLDELLAEYARLGLDASGQGLTSRELGSRWGLGIDAVHRRLQVAKDAGVLRVGRKPIQRLDGAPSMVPCYWIERPAAKPKPRKK